MSDLLKAADDARRLLRGFSAIKEVADALEKAGTLEQTSAELAQAVDAQRVVLAGLTTDVEIAGVGLQAALEKSQATTEGGLRQVRAAQDEADAILQRARDEASAMRLEVADQIKAERKQAEAELLVLGEQEAQLKASVAVLEAKAVEAKAYLSKLAE